MYLPKGTFSPEVTIGLVSASRNCFPRELSLKRTAALVGQCRAAGVVPVVPEGDCAIIESRHDARAAASQLRSAGCDAVVLYLGNFSPEIEDAEFVKMTGLPVMLIAAAEESAATLCCDRGDALCGLLSAALAIRKRGLDHQVYLPPNPVVDAALGAREIAHFARVISVVKGVRNATIGLFGPRPRDFETCNYNAASLLSIGVEIEELGFFDLVNEVEKVRAAGGLEAIISSMQADGTPAPDAPFQERLAAYEKAMWNLRDSLRLSGMTSQCWSEQEFALKHVPCYINARFASRGVPIACENDAYSLVAELMGQYASNAGVTILDINHSIPLDLPGLPTAEPGDFVGMFHCGNTDPRRLTNPQMKHQVIMKRMMEPATEPDITRGTIEGALAASPITVLQVHGSGDKLAAYICEGEFLDLDPLTFGATGTALIPGFRRFYRQVLLGRFHHHAAIAFTHCGKVLYDALRLLGITEIYTPRDVTTPYPDENPFA